MDGPNRTPSLARLTLCECLHRFWPRATRPHRTPPAAWTPPRCLGCLRASRVRPPVARSTARFPVASTNRQAASTFGPMEPDGRSNARRAGDSHVGFLGGRRAKTLLDSGHVRKEQERVGAEITANSEALRSLSMTASAPLSVPSSLRRTGIPPPPAQMTTAPFVDSIRIVASSTRDRGSGEATTRRQFGAVVSNLPARALARGGGLPPRRRRNRRIWSAPRRQDHRVRPRSGR